MTFKSVKLETISPDINFQNAATLFMDHIEKSLKDISDDLLKIEMAKDQNKHAFTTGKIKSKEELREVCGVMKVGALAAQMNLKGEKEFLAVLMTKEKPTFSLLDRLAVAIQANFAKNYHENYKGKNLEVKYSCIFRIYFDLIIQLLKKRNFFFIQY